MNFSAYISSGILELYAMGLTSEEESREVESHVRQYPEIERELLSIQDAMLQYNAAHAVAPRPGLEDQILQRIGQGPAANPAAPTQPATTRKLPVLQWAMAALLVLAVGSLVYFYQQNQQTIKQLGETRTELDQLRQACDDIKNNNAELVRYYAVVGEKGNKPVAMAGTPHAPDALALVHWNKEKKAAYLDVRSLPAPPTGKQYQLWAIVDGKPTDMGVFDIKTDGIALRAVPFIENPQAFAVTLENAGGSPVPTLDQMYVVGNI